MANEIKIKTKLDNSGVKKGLKDTENNFKKSSKNIKKSLSTIDIAIGSIVGNLATDVFRSALGAASDLFRFLGSDAIEAAKQQEDAINALNIALKNTGQFTEEASKDFQEYASSLQAATKFGDEVILQNAALIQSLGGLSQDALKGATQAALDLSAALGIDLTSAATLVGKAAAGEIGSFSRFGVVIKKGATQAETFANALDVLNSKFGGAAAAQIKTFSGASQQLDNVIGDLQESFGQIITENPAVVSAIKSITKIFQNFIKFVDENKSQFDEMVKIVSDALVSIAGFIADAFKFIIKSFKPVFDSIKLFINAWKFLGGAAVEGLGLIIDALEPFEQAMRSSLGAVIKLWANTIGRVVQLTIDGFGEIGKLVGIELPDSFKNFRKNILDVGNEIEKGPLKFKEYSKALKNLGKEIKDNAALDTEVNSNIDPLVLSDAPSGKSSTLTGTSPKVEAKKKENQALLRLQEEFDMMKAERELAQIEADNLSAEERRLKIQEHEDAIFNIQREAIEKLKKEKDLAKQSEIIATAKYQQNEIKNKIKFQKQSLELDKKEQDAKLGILKNTLSLAAGFAKDGSKAQFAIQQASAIASATIAAFQASALALATPPGPPFTIPLSRLALVKGLGNVALITAQTIKGFQAGGIVPGNSFSGDQVPARVNSGEMILNRSQQANLFDMVNTGGGAQATTINIQGNVVANDDSEVDNLINKINERLEFGNASLSV